MIFILHFVVAPFCHQQPLHFTLLTLLPLLLILSYLPLTNPSRISCILAFASGLLFHHLHISSFYQSLNELSLQLSHKHNCLLQIHSLPKSQNKYTLFKSRILMCDSWSPQHNLFLFIKTKQKLTASIGDTLYLKTQHALFIPPLLIYHNNPSRVHSNRIATALTLPKQNSLLHISTPTPFHSPSLFVKHHIINTFLSLHPNILTNPYCAFTLALLFAEQSFVSFSQWETLRNTAISHLIAISGLHISMLSHLFESILLPLFIPFNRHNPLFASRALSAILLITYGCCASFTPSCLRAILMVLCRYTCDALYIKIHPLSNLLLCFFIQYCLDPLVIYNVGFQLSYGIVFSLLVANQFPSLKHPIPNQVAMFIITNTWSLIYWKQVILIASFTNLIAVFWVSRLILPLSLLSLALTPLHPHASNTILNLCHQQWQWLLLIMQGLSYHFKPITFGT